MFSVLALVAFFFFLFSSGLLSVLILHNNIRMLKTRVFNLEWDVRKCSIQIEELDAECRRLKIKIKYRGGGNPF
jgi:hypothetical protein